ncbi:MAG: hypothetical protein ABSF75_00780 [Terracidiphilus sp.]|jgi:hypothetical protein
MVGFLKNHRGTRRNNDEENDWPSIVFLLREPVLPSAGQAIEMMTVAFGAIGPVEFLGTVGPHNFAIRVAPLTFALHAFGSRYEADFGHLRPVQQQCWELHRAWLSLDFPGNSAPILRQKGTIGHAYKTLMYFVVKHWSPNCLALYFPSEQSTLPNRGDLIQSIRLARLDGIDLDFLKVPRPDPKE